MNRNEYEVAIRKSGLDPISRAMLMAAASYRKWKQGEEVEPYLSVAILVEATGFSKNAVAPRYTALREGGWLVPTGNKTHKNATYYYLRVGLSPEKVQGYTSTGDSTIPSEGTGLYPEKVSENGKRMGEEVVERLEEQTTPAAGLEEASLTLNEESLVTVLFDTKDEIPLATTKEWAEFCTGALADARDFRKRNEFHDAKREEWDDAWAFACNQSFRPEVVDALQRIGLAHTHLPEKEEVW